MLVRYLNVAKESSINFNLVSGTKVDVNLCLKTLLWEDQFTDCSHQFIKHGNVVLSMAEDSTPEKLALYAKSQITHFDRQKVYIA